MRDSGFYRQIAQLHIDGISQGFMSTLGMPFLILLYEAIDKCDESVLVVETDNERVLGFVSGASDMKPIYKHMLYRFPKLILALLPSVFRPARIKRILEILQYSSKKSTSPDLPEFELLSIAVTPEARGTGCSDRLYNRLVEYCQIHRFPAFKIIVGDALEPAHRFYQRMGAVAVGRVEVHEGQGSVLYIHKLGNVERT